MKKNYLFLASAALMLAGCSDEADLTQGSTNPQYSMTGISFNLNAPATTRATLSGSDAATKLNNEFVVYGYKTVDAANQTVFNNYKVEYDGKAGETSSNTRGWEYVDKTPYASSKVSPATTATSQTIKYWDYSANSYVFTAFAGKNFLVKDGAMVERDETSGKYSVTIPSTASIGDIYFSDKKTVEKSNTNYKDPVVLTFRNASSKVRVGFYETVEGYSVSIDKFYYDADASAAVTTFKAMDTKATDKFAAALQNVNNEGTTEGSTTTPNKVTVDYGTAADGNADQPVVKTGSGVAYQYTFTMGKGVLNTTLATSSATPTWTDSDNSGYVTVYPNTAVTNPMLIRCDYTLTSLDGSETIKVKNARVTVPAKYMQWKNNYAYTYLFKISNNTNGTTGSNPSDPDNPSTGDPEGLFPITFDAVVEQASDYTQETVSTFASNTVTTYAEKSDVTTANEYKKGATVYFVVSENGKNVITPTVGDNTDKCAQVYKLDKAWSEAEVLAQLTGSNLGITMTVNTTTACTEVPSADGTKLALDGVQSTLSDAGTYAYVYCTTKYVAPTYGSASEWKQDATYYYNTAADGSGVYYVASGINESNFSTYKTKLYTQTNAGTAGVYDVKVVKVAE